MCVRYFLCSLHCLYFLHPPFAVCLGIFQVKDFSASSISGHPVTRKAVKSKLSSGGCEASKSGDCEAAWPLPLGGWVSEERDLCSTESSGEERVQWMGAPGTRVAPEDGLQAGWVRLPSGSSALSSPRMPLSQPPSPRPQLCPNLRCSPVPGGRCRLRRGSRAACCRGWGPTAHIYLLLAPSPPPMLDSLPALVASTFPWSTLYHRLTSTTGLPFLFSSFRTPSVLRSHCTGISQCKCGKHQVVSVQLFTKVDIIKLLRNYLIKII